jgi:hypothetical protein
MSISIVILLIIFGLYNLGDPTIEQEPWPTSVSEQRIPWSHEP